MRTARAVPASNFAPAGQRLSTGPCVARAARGTCPDVDGGGESQAIGRGERPPEVKVGGEEPEASGWWVLFVCVSVSIDACAVAASPPGGQPPAPPPSPRALSRPQFCQPISPRPTLSANQSPLRFRSPKSCGNWLQPRETLGSYLVFELPERIQLEPI